MKLDRPLNLNFDSDIASDDARTCRKITDADERSRQLLQARDDTKCSAAPQAYNTKLDSLLKDIRAHIDKKLLNACKQIENSIALQQYLSEGDLPLSYHGWPISPDIGVFLVEKIEAENYDLIIEFGSGTSTCLLAQSLKNKQKRYPSSGVTRVVSFEHNEEYFKNTEALVRRCGVETFTDITLSPLVAYDYEGSQFSYYDCDEKMRELSASIGAEGGTVLVLVDGPPGATGPLARFPALPKLLQAMPRCRFDVVLDDYNRQEEKDTAKKWFDMMKRMGARYKDRALPMEKGALFISVERRSSS